MPDGLHIYEKPPYGPALEVRDGDKVIVTDLTQSNADAVLALAKIALAKSTAAADPCASCEAESATPKADAYRRQAQAARKAIDSSPAWMRDTAVPPRKQSDG